MHLCERGKEQCRDEPRLLHSARQVLRFSNQSLHERPCGYFLYCGRTLAAPHRQKVRADHHSISTTTKRHGQGCLQREVEDCLLLPFHLFREAIAKNARRSSRECACYLRTGIGRSAKGCTVWRGHIGLRTAKESSAHLNAGRAQLEGGRNPAPIKYPARRDHCYAYRVHHHRDQGHRPDHPAPGAFVKVPRCPPASAP